MIDNNKLIKIITKIGEKITQEKEFLTELDNIIGDGDHGINMARGFSEVEKKLPELNDKDIGTILKTIGMTLVSTVGGASGPLYGTAFMKSGNYMMNKTNLDLNDFIEILKISIEGIKMRGKSTAGEKTMLDSMIPALEAIERESKNNKNIKDIFDLGIKAAENGIEYTKTIKATKGRASYLGERSIGHQDPGATSFTLMLKVIAENI